VVGADGCGPNTLNVIVPDALEPEELDSTELIEPATMANPAVPLAGPVAVNVGEASVTTVSPIPEPQVLTAELLLESPPYDAYHQ